MNKLQTCDIGEFKWKVAFIMVDKNFSVLNMGKLYYKYKKNFILCKSKEHCSIKGIVFMAHLKSELNEATN